MKKRALVVGPLLFAALLGGCAVPSADQGSNPLQDLVDIIPWTKSVAADATTEELTARIAEISARIPTLDMSDATRAELQSKLKDLDTSIRTDPGNREAHSAALNAILDDVMAAIE